MFGGTSEFASSLVECAGCSHVMVWPAPSPQELQLVYSGLGYWRYHALPDSFSKDRWLENLTINGGYWERLIRAKEQLEFILGHCRLPEDARIIDLGSGLSPFLYHCQQHGFTDLHALEPSEEICRHLESQGITAYPAWLETFIERKDLPPFDLILLSHTLEHLIGPDVILRGLRELLSNKGVLLIDVPYRDHLRPFTSGVHIQFFNETSLPRLVEECGLETAIVEVDKLNAIDKAVLKIQYLLYEKRFAGKKITATEILENPFVDGLHRYCWRPLRRMLRLNIHPLLSPQDLKVLARR